MPQCEMCGAERASLTTTKVEGAELELCDSCSEFGTEVRTEPESTTSTKYSTSSSSGTAGGSSGGSTASTTSTGGSGGSGGSSRRDEMLDDIEQLATDYDERIRSGRESNGLTQEELADQLNEKTSLIRKLERGDVLPSDDVERKLERALDISLSEGGEVEDSEWSADHSGSMTLGDVVKRKD